MTSWHEVAAGDGHTVLPKVRNKISAFISSRQIEPGRVLVRHGFCHPRIDLSHHSLEGLRHGLAHASGGFPAGFDTLTNFGLLAFQLSRWRWGKGLRRRHPGQSFLLRGVLLIS